MKLFALIIVCFTLGTTLVKAQSCGGSLGDPVLNETFGYLHNPLPPFKTSYEFVGGCPFRGQYTIHDFLYGCGPMTWVKMTGDHTPYDSAGCYMLVNAEDNPGTIYWDSLKDLCGNTVYQFQAWITSVMTKYACDGNPILPNIIFTLKTLDGKILAVDSTGRLPTVENAEWKPYGFTIRTPPNVTAAIIYITVDPKFGCGAGFGLDDITFRPCGAAISVDIDGTPGPAYVCADYTDSTNPFVMTAKYSGGFADPLMQWQSSVDSGLNWVDIPGETGFVYKVPHRYSGLILYRICIAERSNINSLHCRITSNIIYTRIHQLPAHVAPRNLLGCLNKTFFFPQADLKALQVLWSGQGGYRSTMVNSSIPNIQYSDTGLYKLKETFYFNCVSLDTFYVNVFPSAIVSVQPGYPLCEGMSERLSAVSYDTVSYWWTPPSGLSNDTLPDPMARPTDSTNYKVLITNVYGCQDSGFVPINVFRNPVANAGPDISILRGDTVQLKTVVKGTAINIAWSPNAYIDDNHAVGPHVYPLTDIKYTLKVVSTVGCGSATDEVQIRVYNDIFVPSAFTPNGDGRNDYFQITGIDGYQIVTFVIYNRLGQLVFKSDGSYKGWDGTINGNPQPNGAYVYRLQLAQPSGKRITKQGSFLLVR